MDMFDNYDNNNNNNSRPIQLLQYQLFQISALSCADAQHFRSATPRYPIVSVVVVQGRRRLRRRRNRGSRPRRRRRRHRHRPRRRRRRRQISADAVHQRRRVADAEQERLDGERDDDEAHDGAGYPEHQRVLDLVEDAHQRHVRPRRYVFGRLEGGADEVNATDDNERRRRRAAGQVAALVLVRQDVRVVDEDDEAEQHHAQHPYERVVDERKEHDEYQPAAEEDALTADGSQPAAIRLLEWSLKDLHHRLRLGRDRRPSARRRPPTQPDPEPADEERQRDDGGEEELR